MLGGGEGTEYLEVGRRGARAAAVKETGQWGRRKPGKLSKTSVSRSGEHTPWDL